MSPRVLVVSKLFPRFGKSLSGTFVHSQVRALRRAGVDLQVVVPLASGLRMRRKRSDQPTDTGPDGAPNGESVLYVPYLHVPLALSARMETRTLTFGLARALRELQSSRPFDIVHAHQAFPTGFAALKIARRWGVPLVVTAHGSDIHTNPHRSRSILNFTRTVVDESDVMVTVSGALARQVDELVCYPKDSRVVYSGVDLDGFAEAPVSNAARIQKGLPQSGVGLCTLCRLDSAKGVFELLEAFVQLRKENLDPWLLYIGGGPERESLEKRVDELGMAGSVFFSGAVSHSDVPAWLATADIFALPSHKEGVPVSLLEAMAAGLPAVATDVGGIGEVLEDGRTGYLVPRADPVALHGKIRELVCDASTRERMGAAARELVMDTYLWDHNASAMLELYEEIIAKAVVTRTSDS